MSRTTTKLGPMSIKYIGRRQVEEVIHLGDGMIGFLMDTVEPGETQISNIRFQSLFHDIVHFMKEHDFKTVPLETMDLLEERLHVHRVRKVDMVLPFRVPPSRGNYLKFNPRIRGYCKNPLVVDRLHVEGDKFIVVAMDPSWEPSEF